MENVIEFTAEQYIKNVLSGKQIACKWVKLAVKRHRRDLRTGKKRGLYFDKKSARLAIAFFGFLKHSKGEWAGLPLILEPWQQFIIWVVFGWKRTETGARRFRTVYLEVARKNGKSTMAAGVGLLMMVADGEAGADIFTVATKKEQAIISHSEAMRMVKASPRLRRQIGIFKNNLHIEKTASRFEPLAADSKTLDGLNIHCAICDEVHAWPSRDLWDVLETSTSARTQPLMWAITTAGFNRQSLCYQLNEYAQKILSGVLEDDTFFGIIFTLDQGDDWQDPKLWVKSNPNLGVSKKVDFMKTAANQVRGMPAKLNAFKRLDLNLWTQAVTKFIDREKWDACAGVVNPDGLRGRRCYGGLDLSTILDVSAWVLVFPPEVDGDPYVVLPRFFIPEANMQERIDRDRVPFDVWVRGGLVTATPGNVIDYDYILAQIAEDQENYDIAQIAFDRWGSSVIIQDLMDLGGADWVIQFGQGYKSMSPPTKELERLIALSQISHGNNPVLGWMADNLVVRTDPAGNIKPDKEKSTERIDGMVSLIMALDRALKMGAAFKSVYDDEGI